MPEIKHYVVTEHRQVKVAANTPVDAARLAAKAFEPDSQVGTSLRNKEGLDGVWGDTNSRVRQTELHVEED